MLEWMEQALRGTVLSILGLAPDDQKTVRFPYGSSTRTGSAPAPERGENVCYIYVSPDEDGYGQQYHIGTRDDGDANLTQTVDYTEVYRVNFVCYGDRADLWTREIRVGLMLPEIRASLLTQGIALVTGSQRSAYVQELKDGNWWTRHDLSAQFYLQTKQEYANSVPYIDRPEAVRIHSINERGK